MTNQAAYEDIATMYAEEGPHDRLATGGSNQSTILPGSVWRSGEARVNHRLYVFQSIVLALEILIGFRVFLKLINANPDSGFAWFVYGVTAPFLVPFSGLTPTPAVNGHMFEISSLIAMITIAILYWLILRSWRLISAW